MTLDDKPSTNNALDARRGNWLSRMLGRNNTIIPVVRLHGSIAAEQKPGRINIETHGPVLKRAFKVKSAPAVAIVVNSPGGSAVQSRLVSKLIRDLAREHKKKVLVFIEDVAGSGGYFIAVAGDEIIADPSSIVGSVGVIFAGFGFEQAIEKLGVTRRVYTAGKNKSTADPFMPEKKEDIKRIKQFELDVHKVFIDHVKAHRVGKLKASDDELFTGEWWSGVRGLELGLVDALGDMHQVLTERYGKNVKLKPFGPKRPMFQMPRLGISSAVNGHSIATDAIAALEDRALWSRFGL